MLGTFGMKGNPFEGEKKTNGSNVAYQPGPFRGKSKFFQSGWGGKSVNKGRGRSFIKRE